MQRAQPVQSVAAGQPPSVPGAHVCTVGGHVDGFTQKDTSGSTAAPPSIDPALLVNEHPVTGSYKNDEPSGPEKFPQKKQLKKPVKKMLLHPGP